MTAATVTTAAAELDAYARNAFVAALPDDVRLPLPDEPFVTAWERYAADAAQHGAAAVLRRCLVQLRFPIAQGVADDAAYRAATRRGVGPAPGDGGDGVAFAHPDGIRLFVHPTPAGRIPVIVASDRADFVALVQALTRRNAPDPIPPSMGACIVAGYNNWDRVATLRRAWEAAQPAPPSGSAWAEEFARIAARPELYQDRFILVSTGPYSATPAAALGLAEQPWAAASLTIRLEHECAHYFTRRLFGSMRNSLLDELIADYAGIVAAAGAFHAHWFLRFMGLESFPTYRTGGRLENYRGTPPLGDDAFRGLCALVVAAAHNIERFDRRWRRSGTGHPAATVAALAAFARLGLHAVAGPGGDRALETEAARVRSTMRDSHGAPGPLPA